MSWMLDLVYIYIYIYITITDVLTVQEHQGKAILYTVTQ